MRPNPRCGSTADAQEYVGLLVAGRWREAVELSEARAAAAVAEGHEGGGSGERSPKRGKLE